MRKIDYNKYYAKHCARYYGWLPASKAYRQKVKKKHLKYFTLCGEEAIDVFMLEQAGVLSRDKDKRLPGVFICECKSDVATRIFTLVRPPLREAMIVGPLERILTFEDNEHTRDRSPDEDERNRHIREMLRIKGLAQRLSNYFPFDVINFDTLGNFLNPDDERNKLLYQSFERIFELQKPIDKFLLFVTTPITDVHRGLVSRFKDDLELNVSEYSQIRNALLSSVGAISYEEIDDNKRKSLGFAKSIVMASARNKGWNVERKGIHIYENRELRKMLSSVIQFSRAHNTPDESVYVEDVVRVISQMPEYYSYADSLKDRDVKEHLKGIIEYRERIRDEYREES